MAKYVTVEKLSTFWSGVVDNLTKGVNGKKLTTNDLTNELKTKYDAAQPNTIESIKVNDAVQTIGAEKTVNITVPTKVSELTDASSYYTKTEIDKKISDAIAGKLKKLAVDALPAIEDADDSTIYLVPNSKTEGNNVRDEYLLINGKFELIGSTEVDLSGYLKVSDEATEQDIENIFKNYTPPTTEESSGGTENQSEQTTEPVEDPTE